MGATVVLSMQAHINSFQDVEVPKDPDTHIAPIRRRKMRGRKSPDNATESASRVSQDPLQSRTATGQTSGKESSCKLKICQQRQRSLHQRLLQPQRGRARLQWLIYDPTWLTMVF